MGMNASRTKPLPPPRWLSAAAFGVFAAFLTTVLWVRLHRDQPIPKAGAPDTGIEAALQSTHSPTPPAPGASRRMGSTEAPSAPVAVPGHLQVRELVMRQRELKPTEVQALLAWLRNRERGTDLSRGADRVLVSEALKRLRLQQPPAANLTETALALYRNRNDDAVVRDYAIQHLVLSYEQAADKAQIQQVLWQAAQETDNTIAGTALLALHRLSEQFPEFDPARVDEAARNLATSNDASEAARITALQVCAKRGVVEVIPTALTLARSAPSIPMRTSAIAALGVLGGSELLPWLEQLADDASQPQFHPAARAALRRLNQRLGLQAEPLDATAGAQ
jgi:hypothetical protein